MTTTMGTALNKCTVVASLGSRKGDGYEYTIQDESINRPVKGWRVGTRRQVEEFLENLRKQYELRAQFKQVKKCRAL